MAQRGDRGGMAKVSGSAPVSPVHFHTLVVAHCSRDPAELTAASLEEFLARFITSIRMNVLIPPRAERGPYGFTGLAGIVTSHIAFHYFEDSRTLQFDVYSCRPYSVEEAIRHLDDFWSILDADIVFIEREREANIRRFVYDRGLIQDANVVESLRLAG